MRFGRHFGRDLCLLALLGVLACPRAWAVEEDELKAAIVFNMLLFVEWPADALPPAGRPLVLCAGAASTMAAALKTLRGRPLHGTQLDVRDTELGAVAGECNALFIEAQDGLRAAATVRPGTAARMLVISDDAELPSPDAAIVLRRLGSRVAFDVNLQAARRARLQLSSKLLRLARAVRE